MSHNYSFQNVKDGIQIRACTISKERVAHFCQFISVKIKKILGKSQAKFRERLRKLKLKQNDGLLIKIVYYNSFIMIQVLFFYRSLSKDQIIFNSLFSTPYVLY